MLDFFVLGNPRSGTTLFRIMLNSHPDITIPPECGFALWLAKKYPAPLQYSDYIQFSYEIRNTRKFETWGIEEKNLLEKLSNDRPRSYGEMVKAVYKLYAEKREKRPKIFGDKNNFYIKMTEELKNIFPLSKRLYIIRDLRDVASSYLEVSSMEIKSDYRPSLSTSMKNIANEWDRNAERITKDSENTAYYVRYEDLVTKPEETLELVCRFLEIPYSEKMLQYQSGNDEPSEFLQWKEKTKKKLDKNNIGKYLTTLSRDQLNQLEEISYHHLRNFNYL